MLPLNKEWFLHQIKVWLSILRKVPYKRLIIPAIIVLVMVLNHPMQRLVIKINSDSHRISVDSVQYNLIAKKLDKDLRASEGKLAKKTPQGAYLIINSSANEFSLYKGMKLIQHDKCSTGSYILLQTEGDKEYLFKTPKGEFKIRGKIESPVWRKPDWAFIEEGLPVPSATHQSRYEAGVLGDYALSLGDGYLIHGTLYQRFLGLPVTHGCIRLNDQNLELVYKNLAVGSKVYIF